MSVSALNGLNIEQLFTERVTRMRAEGNLPAARLNVGRVYVVGASFAPRVDFRGHGIDAVAIVIEYP